MLLFAAASLAPRVALAAESEGISAWVGGGHAEARLLATGPRDPAGPTLAGIEIRLDPGAITYWRNPGDAGLPPTVDTAGSINIARASLHFPAPHVFDEAGSTANGYADDVTLPLDVTLLDASRPAVLDVELHYAVCASLCLPAAAHLRLTVPQRPVPEAAAILDAAVAAVPRTAALGTPGVPAVQRVAPVAGGSALDVTVNAAEPAALFVEAPEGWFLQPGPPRATGPGEWVFPVAVEQRPDGAKLEGLALRLTLVDRTGAVDVTTHMDAGTQKP